MTRVISIYEVTRRARAAHIVKSTRVTRIEIFNQVLIKIMIHMTFNNIKTILGSVNREKSIP